MNKKKLYISAGSLGVVAAFAIAVSVPIAVIDHDKSWDVSIASTSKSYTLLKLDTSQNKPALTSEDKMLWNLRGNEKDQVSDAAKFLGINEEAQVQATIGNSADDKIKDGLHDFLNDLVNNLKANSDKLTISFPKAIEVPDPTPKDPKHTKKITKVLFGKEFINATPSERKTALMAAIDGNAAKGIDANNAKYLPELIKNLWVLKANYTATAVKDDVRKTTVDDFKEALTNVTK